MQRQFLIQFMADTDDAAQQIAELSARLGGVAKAADEVDAGSVVAITAVSAMAASMTALAVGSIWAGAKMREAIMEVEPAFLRAGTTVDEMRKHLGGLSGQMTKLMEVSMLGAQAGIEGADALTEFTAAAKRVGLVAGTGAMEAAAGLRQMVQQLGMTTPQAEQLTMAMARLEHETGLSVQTSQMLIQRVGGIAQQAGIAQSFVLGLGGALQRAGIRGYRVVGMVNQFVQMMQSGTQQGDQFNAVLSAMTGRQEDWAAMNPEKKFLMFIDALKGMSKTEADAYLDQVGIKGGMLTQQLKALGQNMPGLTKEFDLAKRALADSAWGMAEAEEHEMTLGNQLEKLRDSFVNIGMYIGEKLEPIVTRIVWAFRGFIDAIVWLVNLPVIGTLLAIGVAFAGIAGGLMSTAVWVVNLGGKIGGMVNNTLQAVKAFSDLARSQGFAAAVSGIFTKAKWAENWALVKSIALNMAMAVWHGIVAAAQFAVTIPIWLHVAALWAYIGVMGVVNFVTATAIPFLWGLATAAWAAIAPFLPFIVIAALVIGALYLLVKGFIWLWDAVGGWEGVFANLQTSFNWVVGGLEWIWDGIKSLWDMIGGFSGFVALMLKIAFFPLWIAYEAITYVIENFAFLYDKVVAVGEALYGWIVAPFKAIADGAKAVWSWLFGSGLFGIPEAALVASASLLLMTNPLFSILQLAGLINTQFDKMPSSITTPDMTKGRLIEEGVTTLPYPTAPRGSAEPGVRDQQTAAGAGAGAGAVSTMGGTAAHLTIPITVEMDGMTIARAIAEYNVEMRRDRMMLEPLSPMRGLEKG